MKLKLRRTSGAFRRRRPKKLRNSHSDLDQAAPILTVSELANFDAIVIGVPTRFGRISSQIAGHRVACGCIAAARSLAPPTRSSPPVGRQG